MNIKFEIEIEANYILSFIINLYSTGIHFEYDYPKIYVWINKEHKIIWDAFKKSVKFHKAKYKEVPYES